MGILTAAVVTRMVKVRATKARGLVVVVHDSSADNTVKTLEESVGWELLKYTDEDKEHKGIQTSSLRHRAPQVKVGGNCIAGI